MTLDLLQSTKKKRFWAFILSGGLKKWKFKPGYVKIQIVKSTRNDYILSNSKIFKWTIQNPICCIEKVCNNDNSKIWNRYDTKCLIQYTTKAYNGNPLSNYQPKKIIIRLLSYPITCNFPNIITTSKNLKIKFSSSVLKRVPSTSKFTSHTICTSNMERKILKRAKVNECKILIKQSLI